MEQSNYEMRESKLIRHGQRVSVGTLVFSLIAALYALSCVLLQYGVIPLEGAGRIALIAAGGGGTLIAFLLVLIDSFRYRREYRQFTEDFGDPKRPS